MRCWWHTFDPDDETILYPVSLLSTVGAAARMRIEPIDVIVSADKEGKHIGSLVEGIYSECGCIRSLDDTALA